MSGRGKTQPTGKGKGKQAPKGRAHIPRRENIQDITKPAIRRLGRRGGTRRISDLLYEEVRQEIGRLLEGVVQDAITYAEHARRKTVTAKDVEHAFKLRGLVLCGFGV